MIELEHTLIMLLLLVNLLRARPGIHPSLRWLAIGVILLAFLAPSTPLALPWGVFAAIFIPILLWQSAQQLGNASWFEDRRDFIIWLSLTLGIMGVILLTGGLPFTSSLFFGLLAASLAWNTISQYKKDTLLGQIGVLTLVFLLTGIEAAIESPGQFLLVLLAGGAIGAAVGYFSVLAANRLSAGLQRDVFSIAQVYLAYGIGWLTGMSAAAAAVLSIAVYVGYGTRRGLWAGGQIQPRPFDHSAIFAIGVAALAFFGWQTHIPFTATVILEVVLALVLTAIVFWVGRSAKSITPAIQDNLRETLFRVGFLLAAALLLWPKSMLIDPVPLFIALGFAGITAIIASILLSPMLNLFSWLEETRAQTAAESTAPALQVKELMRREYLAILPNTPVEQIPAAFDAHDTSCALVVHPSGKLTGIITEADLFVKEEKLPRTDITYLALFQQPIEPENIFSGYDSIRGQYRASDIMTHPVITIQCDQPIIEAIRLFLTHRLEYIPVMDAEGDNEERLIGLLTRRDLIGLFFAPAGGSAEHPPVEQKE